MLNLHIYNIKDNLSIDCPFLVHNSIENSQNIW